MLCSTASHAVANVRRAQFLTIESEYGREIAKGLILGKIKNQRATLQYFYKYQKNTNQDTQKLAHAIEALKNIINSLKNLDLSKCDNWLNILLGKEGSSASLYFQALSSDLFYEHDFVNRQGRGASDIINSSLNYGYAILTSFVWQSI